MIGLKVTGAKATIDGMTHVVNVTPGRSVSAMNDAVKHARKETVRKLVAETGLPRRLLAGAGTRGRGGHIKRSVARVRRPWAKLIGLVAGVRLARVGLKHAGRSPMNMPYSTIPRLFWQTTGRHRGVFARHPLPSMRVSGGSSPGTKRKNLPINEAVIQIYPQARRIMTQTMDYASRVIYPRALWKKLDAAIRRKAARAGKR